MEKELSGRRQQINTRIGTAGIAWIDQIALDESVHVGHLLNRSDVMRAALAVARDHEREVRAILRRRVM